MRPISAAQPHPAPPDPLRATHHTRLTAAGATVVAPEGRLNAAVAADLRAQLLSLVDAGNTLLIVDLAKAESVDSSGVGALIGGLKAARAAGGDLRISAPNTRITTVLELMQLTRLLVVEPDPDTAFVNSV